jgi:hypothetical protein
MNIQTGSPATAIALSNPWAVVPSLGHLDAYISAVNRMPMLTLEEEQEAARQLKANDDLEAARKLVLSHLRLVVSVSRQYLGYGLPHGDLSGHVATHIGKMVVGDVICVPMYEGGNLKSLHSAVSSYSARVWGNGNGTTHKDVANNCIEVMRVG